MDYFSRIDGVLHAEQVSLVDIANQYGTPAYDEVRQRVVLHLGNDVGRNGQHWVGGGTLGNAPGDAT